MPFLILIAAGVIMILLFNLWRAVFTPAPTADAYMHVESGSVEMKTWGTEEYFNLSSDTVVMQGDELKTSADAQVIIEFLDGTIMRIDGGSSVVFDGIFEKGDIEMIEIFLEDGKVWFNKMYKDTATSNIFVKMDNINVTSDSGSIFELENDFEEVVRVMNGDQIEIEIKSMDDSKIVETEQVGVGQEIVFNDKVLDRYWQYQSPSVLAALSDGFKQSTWYEWNVAEDLEPTQFSKALGGNNEFVEVEPEVFEPSEEGEVVDGEEEVVDGEVMEPEVVEEEPEAEEDEEEKEVVVELGPLQKPVITSVQGVSDANADGFYVVTGRLATLAGTVSGADKVVVNGYTLSKFSAGDASWTYYANADFGLMVEGENTYEVYALGADGTRSESIYVKVLHQPAVVEEVPAEEPVAEPEPVVEEPVVVDEEPVAEEADSIPEDADLPGGV